MECGHQRQSRRAIRNKGFTLVELIIALAVLAVALSGLIALYGVSLELAKEARQKTVAVELASTQMAALSASPEQFIWHVDDSDATALFPITRDEDAPAAGNIVASPEVMLVNRNAHVHNENFYNRFRWKAWGRLSSPDAQAYEITVAVYWRARGKQRSLALTSSVPRYRIPANDSTVGDAGP